MARRFKWVVELSVDESWVADGFDLTNARALSMLSHDLGYANIDTELGAKVISAPPDAEIAKAQGYSLDAFLAERARS